jgi:hypothetical protein
VRRGRSARGGAGAGAAPLVDAGECTAGRVLCRISTGPAPLPLLLGPDIVLYYPLVGLGGEGWSPEEAWALGALACRLPTQLKGKSKPSGWGQRGPSARTVSPKLVASGRRVLRRVRSAVRPGWPSSLHDVGAAGLRYDPGGPGHETRRVEAESRPAARLCAVGGCCVHTSTVFFQYPCHITGVCHPCPCANAPGVARASARKNRVCSSCTCGASNQSTSSMSQPCGRHAKAEGHPGPRTGGRVQSVMRAMLAAKLNSRLANPARAVACASKRRPQQQVAGSTCLGGTAPLVYVHPFATCLLIPAHEADPPLGKVNRG